MKRCLWFIMLSALLGVFGVGCDIDADNINSDKDDAVTETDVTDPDNQRPDLSGSKYTDDDGDGLSEDAGDCNDSNKDIYPGADEICGDGIDNDCNAATSDDCGNSDDTDESDQVETDDPEDTDPPMIDLFDVDDDGDGFTENQGDCNDNNPAVHPDADEICNGLDDDCDSKVDNWAIDSRLWYIDADGDGLGYGDVSTSVVSCDQPVGRVNNFNDCDDSVDNGYRWDETGFSVIGGGASWNTAGTAYPTQELAEFAQTFWTELSAYMCAELVRGVNNGTPPTGVIPGGNPWQPGWNYQQGTVSEISGICPGAFLWSDYELHVEWSWPSGCDQTGIIP